MGLHRLSSGHSRNCRLQQSVDTHLCCSSSTPASHTVVPEVPHHSPLVVSHSHRRSPARDTTQPTPPPVALPPPLAWDEPNLQVPGHRKMTTDSGKSSAVGSTRQAARDGKAEHSGDGGFRQKHKIWGSEEETDICNTKGGGWIISLVFWSSIGGRFGGAQCRR
jgi:hypothetical protein